MDSVNYTPPPRRSMSDEQLALVLGQPHTGEASMIAAMQLLEQQTALRAEDERLQALWALEMQVINTPESIAALNASRGMASAVAPQSSAQPAQISNPAENFDASQSAVAPAFAPASAPAPASQQSGSLFDQIAAAKQPEFREALSAAPVAPTVEPIRTAASEIAPEPQAAAPQAAVPQAAAPQAAAPQAAAPQNIAADAYPLVPVAPAPDISVAAVEISAPAAFEPVAAVPVVAEVTNLPVQADLAASAISVEQQVTEFEESRSELDDFNQVLDSDAAASQTSSEASTQSGASVSESGATLAAESEAAADIEGFSDILETDPMPAADYIDEARSSISTAHGPNTNQPASAMFFNWLPIGGSVLPVVLAVYVHSLGLALTDAVSAVLIAIFAAFITTTAGAIAGKRAGLPTFVVSRATFGVFGARIPAAFFAILKLATASVMVLLLVIASSGAVDGWSVEGASATRWDVGPVSVALWQIIIGASVLLVAITSFVRLRYIKFLNLVVGIIASLGVIGALAFELYRHGFDVTFYYLESWPETLGAAAIVFAALGTVWSSSGADFASALRQDTKGSSVVGWSSLSLLILPGAISVATLVLLESKKEAPELLGLATIVPSLAAPYAYGVFAAVALLLAAIELRSTRLAVRGLYTRWSGALTQSVLAFIFVAISLAGWHFYSSQGLLYNLRDYALILSVPVAAWLGIFSVDSIIRRIAYHEISLTRSYGFYGNYNLTNLFGWALASAAGLGMVSSTLTEFSWTGFLAQYAVHQDFWVTSNLGIALAFAIGALFPLCFGIPRIKRQEAEVLSIESRRYELRDVLVTTEIEQVQPAVLRGESNI